MNWCNLGYDLRSPLSKRSNWRVGDLGFDEFTELLGSERKRINRILSFDLNLSPRPNAIESNQPGSIDITYGGYGSFDEACNNFSNSLSDIKEGVLVFWQVEENAFIRASSESWFNILPESEVLLPSEWVCLGLDVVNDQGVSEYWDISEDFWGLSPELPYKVNQYGLIDSEALIANCLPDLPIDPANHWVMPVKAWIRKKDLHKLN